MWYRNFTHISPFSVFLCYYYYMLCLYMLLTQTYVVTITTVFFSFKEAESRKARKYIFIECSINLCIYYFLFSSFLTLYLSYHLLSFHTSIPFCSHLSPLCSFSKYIFYMLQSPKYNSMHLVLCIYLLNKAKEEMRRIIFLYCHS